MLTREGLCSVCKTAPVSICEDEVQVCGSCLAVLWHLRRPATPKYRPPAEPRGPEPLSAAPDAQIVAEAPASSPESPPEPALRDEKGRFVRPDIVRVDATSEPPVSTAPGPD